MKNEDCFVGEDGKVGWTNQATHSIDTGDNRPVKQPPPRTGLKEKDMIEKVTDLLLEQKIQASESPWASPVLLIKKRNGTCFFALITCISMNYCTAKKELLAIIATLDHWDTYLSCVSEPFILRKAISNKAMLRWCDAVNKYNFVLLQQFGAKHQNTDALSTVCLTRCGWEQCPDCN